MDIAVLDTTASALDPAVVDVAIVSEMLEFLPKDSVDVPAEARVPFVLIYKWAYPTFPGLGTYILVRPDVVFNCVRTGAPKR